MADNTLPNAESQKKGTEDHQCPGVYNEDIVRSKDGKKIGLVLKTARDDSSDESSGSEEEEEEGKIKDGQVLIAWYSLNTKRINNEEVVDEKSIVLADRSVLPGDVVRWTENSNGKQKAQILNVNVFVDVKIVGTNYVLHNIEPREHLKPLERFQEGEPVVMNSWIGVVAVVNHQVTLRLKNGSRCVVEGETIDSLTDATDLRDEDSTFYCDQFYPSQQVQATGRVFKNARWITGSRPAISNSGRVKAIVEEAVIKSVNVEWQLCGFTGDLNEVQSEPPPFIIERSVIESGKLNTVNERLSECHIQLGDKRFYTLTAEDVKNYEKHLSEPKANSRKDAQAVETGAATSSVAVAKDGRTVVDDDPIMDGDDVDEDDIDSEGEGENDQTNTKTCIPDSHPQKRPSACGRPRRKRHARGSKRKRQCQPAVFISPGSRVCVEICGLRTYADTIWQNGEEQKNIHSIFLTPVIHLDEKEYFPGDFVVDKRGDPAVSSERFGVAQSSDDEARIVDVCWLSFANNDNDMFREYETNVSVYDIEDHKDYTFRIGDTVVRLASGQDNSENHQKLLAPAGTVVKVNIDGTILIWWVDNTMTSVLPSQVFLIANDKNDEGGFHSDDSFSDGTEDENEWETASEESGGLFQNEGQDHMNILEDVITRSLAALQTPNNHTSLVTAMDQRTTEFLSALDRQFIHPHIEHMDPNNQESSLNEHLAENDNNEVESAMETTTANKRTEDNDSDSTCTTINDALTSSSEKSDSFTTLPSAPTCHKFYDKTLQPTNQRLFSTAVLKEIKLFKTHLPEGIIVKAFEDRMDIYSALITGPRGTPYEDGLFYFDIQLPVNYPVLPPLVHYHSYCSARLNPNLYEDGKVCVSLLGTWTGKGSETWTSKSTLHQVLTSIQGLILCEEPYYNEAGYEDHRGSKEGLENSRLYNEMSIVKMLQSIRHMINRPPEIFHREVVQHFQKTLPRLVDVYTKWLEENPPKAVLPSYPLFPISKGFETSVKRVLEDLKKNFDTWTKNASDHLKTIE